VIAERIILNRFTSGMLVNTRTAAHPVVADRIGGIRLPDGRVQINFRSAKALLRTDEGREVFSLIVSCAMADDVTLVATIDDTEYEFFGDMGLAPSWLQRPLTREGQGWVSACMFARVNAHDVAVPISLRGSNRGLAVSVEERDAWSVEEGAFFGNYFGPLDEPLAWYACRGEGQLAGEFGGLVDRDCTEADPANPGFTQCGFIDAGVCGDLATGHACESYSEQDAFYGRCSSRLPLGSGASGSADVRVFAEVITSFVTL
jgi:hypothetical protein